MVPGGEANGPIFSGLGAEFPNPLTRPIQTGSGFSCCRVVIRPGHTPDIIKSQGG